jgi:hypothetical protein
VTSLLLLLIGQKTFAAACCGSAGNIPSLITTDDRTQLGLSVGHSQAVLESQGEESAVLRGSSDQEFQQILKLEGASLLSDKWQFGFGVPVSRRSRQVLSSGSAASMGVGDVSFQVSYEILPEYLFSSFRPKGYVFFGFTVPTGVSAYQSLLPFRVDVTGRGFFRPGMGFVFVKSWNYFDAFLMGEGHVPLPRTFETSLGSLGVSAGYGVSGTLGVGWNFLRSMRLGLSLSPSYDGPVTTAGAYVIQTPASWVVNTGLQASILFDDLNSLSVLYQDQALVGWIQNNTASRGIFLSYQKRWTR